MAHQLPQPLLDLLESAFAGQEVRVGGPTTGGFSNLSFFARVGGRRCVVKAAQREVKRADLRREAQVLGLLSGRGLRAAALVALVEDDAWTALVTTRRAGAPGMLLYAGPPADLAAPLEALGARLARLHALELAAPADEALLLAPRAAALAARLCDLPLPDLLRDALAAALAHAAWRPASPRLVHGDAGLHNVLWGREGLALLDWELAGWGDPRLDLAWAAWTLRFRGLPPACWDALLTGYGAERPAARGLDPASARALALGQVAALLARSAGRPAWDEWLRRAGWTAEEFAGI